MLREFGFDYGLKPRLMLVADISFPEYFQKAKCVAVAFVHCPDSKGNLITTELGFLCEVEEYAEKLMDCLMQWVIDSGDDGDAVEMEFIELLNGEYMLAFAPNVDRFLKRMLTPVMIDRVDTFLNMVTQSKSCMRVG
jgi:hypothetical protein